MRGFMILSPIRSLQQSVVEISQITLKDSLSKWHRREPLSHLRNTPLCAENLLLLYHLYARQEARELFPVLSETGFVLIIGIY